MTKLMNRFHSRPADKSVKAINQQMYEFASYSKSR